MIKDKKITVNIKLFQPGEFVRIPNRKNSYCWDTLKDKWVQLYDLNYFGNSTRDEKLPLLSTAISRIAFARIFNTFLTKDVCCTFVGYSELCGALIVSDTLFIEGTTKEMWELDEPNEGGLVV